MCTRMIKNTVLYIKIVITCSVRGLDNIGYTAEMFGTRVG